MSNNNINYLQPVSKFHFDMIITIMLHDACHDFDNGKTDAAFKEYFFFQHRHAQTIVYQRLMIFSRQVWCSWSWRRSHTSHGWGHSQQQLQIKVHNLQELHQNNSL